jgi:hypothetical protein
MKVSRLSIGLSNIDALNARFFSIDIHKMQFVARASLLFHNEFSFHFVRIGETGELRSCIDTFVVGTKRNKKIYLLML